MLPPGTSKGKRLDHPLLVTILTQAFFAFVGGDFMPLSIPATWHLSFLQDDRLLRREFSIL